MKIKALLEGILAGVISAIFSYYILISKAITVALATRHKMPNAWFSGLIVWYAMFLVIGISVVIAVVVCRIVYKHAARRALRP